MIEKNRIETTENRADTLNRFTKLSTLMDKCFFSALLIVFLGVTALFAYLYFEADKKAYIKTASNAKTANITVSTLLKAYFSSLPKLQQDFISTGLISGENGKNINNENQNMQYLLPVLNGKFIRYILHITPDGKVINSIPDLKNKTLYGNKIPDITELIKKNPSGSDGISKPFRSVFPFKAVAYISPYRDKLLRQDGFICFIIDFNALTKYIYSSPYIDKDTEKIWIVTDDGQLLFNSENKPADKLPEYIHELLNNRLSDSSIISSYTNKTQSGHTETVYVYLSEIKLTEYTNWIICAEAC
jgi:hypothetical protein